MLIIKKRGKWILIALSIILITLLGYGLEYLWQNNNRFLMTVQTVSDTPNPDHMPQEKTAEGKININTATVEELDTLPGIGASYAERIVRYREEHGDFYAPEELMNVEGIGQKKFEQLKELIIVE
jgi:comEA protein